MAVGHECDLALLETDDVSFFSDLEALEMELESEAAGDNRWPVHLDPGPHSMLVSGQWDATSQLLSHGLELRNTASRLPYLQAFAPDVVAQALSQAKA